MHKAAAFSEVFTKLALEGQREQTFPLGGVNVRLVWVAKDIETATCQ